MVFLLPKLLCTLKQQGCSGIIQTLKQNEVIAFMKPCPKCGEQIKKTLKFCVYCGCNIAQEEAKAKAKFCGECGAQIEDGMRFCGECGAKVDVPAKQNDDPWASVGQEAKDENPWADFGDTKQEEPKNKPEKTSAKNTSTAKKQTTKKVTKTNV